VTTRLLADTIADEHVIDAHLRATNRRRERVRIFRILTVARL